MVWYLFNYFTYLPLQCQICCDYGDMMKEKRYFRRASSQLFQMPCQVANNKQSFYHMVSNISVSFSKHCYLTVRKFGRNPFNSWKQYIHCVTFKLVWKWRRREGAFASVPVYLHNMQLRRGTEVPVQELYSATKPQNTITSPESRIQVSFHQKIENGAFKVIAFHLLEKSRTADWVETENLL